MEEWLLPRSRVREPPGCENWTRGAAGVVRTTWQAAASWAPDRTASASKLSRVRGFQETSGLRTEESYARHRNWRERRYSLALRLRVPESCRLLVQSMCPKLPGSTLPCQEPKDVKRATLQQGPFPSLLSDWAQMGGSSVA